MNKNLFAAPGIIIGTLLLIVIATVIYGLTVGTPFAEPEYGTIR